jgi:hypothetical protein
MFVHRTYFVLIFLCLIFVFYLLISGTSGIIICSFILLNYVFLPFILLVNLVNFQ